MMIAGCAGGGHAGGSALPGGGSSPSSLTNGAKVTVSIAVAPKQTLSGRRLSTKARPQAAGKRVPSFISPSTSSIAISAVAGGATAYTAIVNLSSCTDLYSVYQCSTNLPIGTFTLYTNLYDGPNATGNWLGTNLYLNPVPQDIYANGAAPYGNYLYADVAGIAKYVFALSPINCNTENSGSTYAELYTLDADDNPIFGPLANPLTGHVTAVNGAGQGAIDIYATSIYGTGSADNQVISDTSIYTPFVYFTGAEGSVFLYGFTYNIPAEFGSGSNGAAGFQLGSQSSPAYAQLTSGTYNLVALTPGNPAFNVYTLEESVPAIVSCNSVHIYPGLNSPTLINSLRDSSGNNTEIVAIDGQNVDLVGDGLMFYTSGGVPQLAFTAATYTLSGTETAVNLFSSPDVQGRFFVITNNGGIGQADQFLSTNGVASLQGTYSLQFPADTYTRIAGEGSGTQYALYYTQSNTSGWLYGVDRTTNTQYAPIQIFSSGDIFTLQPSGANYNYIFIRGWAGGATYDLCTFDPTLGLGSLNCLSLGSGNSNPVSLRFEAGTGEMMAITGTTIKGGNAQVPPGSFSMFTLYTGFPTSQARFIPGESSPGLVGVYDGTSTTTFLQYNGASWVYEATLSWPNASIVPLQ